MLRRLVTAGELGDIYYLYAQRVNLGIVRRDEMIPRETFRPGDRIRSYLFDVRSEVRGPQIFLSRSHPQFMAKLFGQEVPEIYDGIVEIKAVARDPGSRAKIGVISRDSSVDPVGACVGMRGSRVQAVVGELQGEKIDIIPWSEDEATFIVNALQPAEVVKVVLDEEADRIEVVVPDEQLSLAIGRRRLITVTPDEERNRHGCVRRRRTFGDRDGSGVGDRSRRGAHPGGERRVQDYFNDIVGQADHLDHAGPQSVVKLLHQFAGLNALWR